MWWEEKKWESTRGDTTVAPDLALENKKNGAKRLGSQSTTHKPHAIGRRKRKTFDTGVQHSNRKRHNGTIRNAVKDGGHTERREKRKQQPFE